MASTRKQRSKATASRALTELGEKDAEEVHKWSWLLFIFCLPQRSQYRRRRNNRNGSRRVVLTPYSQPEIARVPMPPQLRSRPRSMLLAQQPSEPQVTKRQSRVIASSRSSQDEREQLLQDTSFAAVPVTANNPVKRLSSTSRHSLLACSSPSRSSSPIQRMRLQATKSHQVSSDLATTDVMPSSTASAQTLNDSTCPVNQMADETQVEPEPPRLTRPLSVRGIMTLHQEETFSTSSVPPTPASLPASMTRPQTTLSEESRLSMASSKFSLTTFPLPPSQLPPLPPMPMRRSASEASLYPRSEASVYSHSSLAHSIRSSIMSRPHSIYRKAVKSLPRNPQYFLDILDEHMDVPPPVPLKIRPSSSKPTLTFNNNNNSSTPAPLELPPSVPSIPRTMTPPDLRIETTFEEQSSPDWDVTWDDFDNILDEWDDTLSVTGRPMSQATAGSDFQSKSSVTGDYLHIVERIRSQNTSPASSVSSVAANSPRDVNKALPPPPISQLPDLEPDSSTEGDPWSPHSEGQPATPSRRTNLQRALATRRSQSSLSKGAMPPPRSHFHIAHCAIVEPPPRNPARRTKHQISNSLGSNATAAAHQAARTSNPMGKDYRRIVSYASSSIGGGFEGARFVHTSSKTPPPTASVVPGLEGGYF